ncbi:MAG: DUF2254 domain-containing protein [Candidatus Tectimicrobiota bacterium]
MKTRWLALWDTLRSSFWLVPALMSLAAVALSIALVALDGAIQDKVLRNIGWIWIGGAEGARSLLEAVASSMITVAGVVFSITMVALTMASAQFGPRLLRNFMRDTGNQVVLGTFVATFIYCVLVLRTIRSGDDMAFVPYIAVTGAIVLALASLGVLIYFIHHTSTTIQVSNVIGRVSLELDTAITRLYPQQVESGEPGRRRSEPLREIPAACERQGTAVAASRRGYLQGIDYETLLRLAQEYDCLLCLQTRPGSFVIAGSTLALVWPAEHLDTALVKRVRDACVVGSERTSIQDVEFCINQLVELAVRALSPGINDPFTAITCIDHLGAALCHLAQRLIPSPYRYDEAKHLRLIVYPVTFASVTETALNQIRQYGCSSVAVTLRLLETLAVVAAYTYRDEDRAALRRQATMIEHGSRQNLPHKWDYEDIQQRYHTVMQALQQHKE